MTREEQRLQACENWGESYENKLDYLVKKAAFVIGAEWADNNHPQDVVNLNDIWHPANEEPEDNNWEILLEDKIGDYWVEGECSVSFFYDSWQKYAEDVGLTRWAYISDLLPKGGKK